MSEQTKPVLQKPPGYRDPNAPVYPRPRPPTKKPVLPLSLHQRKKRRRRCRFCCCYATVILLLLLLLAAVCGCFFYLYYQPHFPVFYLQSLKFSRFKLTSGPDGPSLSSQAVVRIEVRNPNSVLRLNYGKSVVELSGEGVDLGTAKRPEFRQGRKNTTVLKFTVAVRNVVVESGTAAKKLKGGVRNKRVVVRTEVRTGIGVAADWWSSVKVGVRVLCDGVSLKKVEAGAVPKCSVYMFKCCSNCKSHTKCMFVQFLDDAVDGER
ncbi:unnamed protein product [Camellia sinensis]